MLRHDVNVLYFVFSVSSVSGSVYNIQISVMSGEREIQKDQNQENIPELSGDGVLGTVGTVEGVVVVVTDGIVDDIGVDVGANDVTEGNGVCPQFS